MSFLARLAKPSTSLNLTRSYTQVVNAFGKGSRTVDTQTNEHKAELKPATIAESAEKIGELSGIADASDYLNTRTARIFIQAKNSMQSGTFQQRKWKIEFDNNERWENPNMGWSSTGDAFSNLAIEFSDKEAAVLYCERMGYKYKVDEPHLLNKRIKTYGANFSWNKKTRRSTK